MLSLNIGIKYLLNCEKYLYSFILVCFLFLSFTPLPQYPYELTSPILVCGLLLSFMVLLNLVFSLIYRENTLSRAKVIIDFPIIILATICATNLYQNQYNIWGLYLLNMILLFLFLKKLLQDSVFDGNDIRNLILCTFSLEGLMYLFLHLFGIQEYSYSNNHIISMVIVMGMPFIYHKSNLSFSKIILIHSFVGVIIYLLGSRTGLIGMFVNFICTVYIIRKTINLNLVAKILAIVFSFISIIGFINLNIDKKESSDGRLIIWKNSIEIIKHQSILGSGLGSFKKQIAIQFIKYFATERPETEKDNFTNQINIAYNDVIQLFIECGIWGLIFYTALAAQVFQNFSHLAIPIISFITMGLTNSVFYIVPCGYILILSLVLLDKSIFSLNVPNKFVLISLITISIFSINTTIKYEKAIRTTKSISKNIDTKMNLKQLKQFSKILNNNEYYWLIVAKNFYKVGNRKNTTMAATKAINTSNDYRAYDLLAVIANKEGSHTEEKYLKITHFIVPGLVLPKFNLFTFYKENCMYEQAEYWAKEVLNHQKKGTRDISYFKQQAKIYLENEK